MAIALFRNIASMLVTRLRRTTEWYRNAVAFDLESVGGSALNLRVLSEELQDVEVHLLNGEAFAGRLVLVDQHAAGLEPCHQAKRRRHEDGAVPRRGLGWHASDAGWQRRRCQNRGPVGEGVRQVRQTVS